VSSKVLTEGVRARSAVLKCAAIPSGVCSRHAMRCSLYVLQASSYPTIVTRRSAVLKCAAIPSGYGAFHAEEFKRKLRRHKTRCRILWSVAEPVVVSLRFLTKPWLKVRRAVSSGNILVTQRSMCGRSSSKRI
jgi:hypothetical protein